MQDNTSLPASLRQRLELVQQHRDRGQPERAEAVMQEMARTLATSAPELCALLLAKQLGHTGFETTETERRERTRSFNGRSMQIGRAFESETIKEFRQVIRAVRLI